VTATPGDRQEAARPAADMAPVYASVEAYYTDKIRTFGATPLGVDWPSTPSLELRLVQLFRACEFKRGRSINDLGCGYAAALDLMERRFPHSGTGYTGVDLSPAMIGEAERKWKKRPATAFLVGHECTRVADYSIASGIFNVKLDNDLSLWKAHVRRTLANLHLHSRRAFAVNFMLPTPATLATPQLYCCQPDEWVAYCAGELGRSVEVVQDYGLDEYSLLVR
jgi:SAM-dependent methyltransferase